MVTSNIAHDAVQQRNRALANLEQAVDEQSRTINHINEAIKRLVEEKLSLDSRNGRLRSFLNQIGINGSKIEEKNIRWGDSATKLIKVTIDDHNIDCLLSDVPPSEKSQILIAARGLLTSSK
jgi:regulator of replication initiation timing